jgi:TetR/AcrR family transcriptional repressor of lmrAB and yxaGH operons
MPRPVTVSRQEVLRRMRSAFRASGYDGASLADLAESTGLTRAALYHHFPDGKAQMAAAVLDDLSRWSFAHILQPLRQPGEPLARLRAMTLGVEELYAGGHEACLIGLFSIGDPLQRFGQQLRRAISDLVGAIEGVLVEAGIARDIAHERAQDAVVRIQGALVVARVLEDTDPFERLMRSLPEQLLESPRTER